jgi:hypothetical protein
VAVPVPLPSSAFFTAHLKGWDVRYKPLIDVRSRDEFYERNAIVAMPAIHTEIHRGVQENLLPDGKTFLTPHRAFRFHVRRTLALLFYHGDDFLSQLTTGQPVGVNTLLSIPTVTKVIVRDNKLR